MDWKEYLKPNKEKLKYFLVFTIPLILFVACVHYFLYHYLLDIYSSIEPMMEHPMGEKVWRAGLQDIKQSFIWFWFVYPFTILGGYLFSCEVYRGKIKIREGELRELSKKERVIVVIIMLVYWIPVTATISVSKEISKVFFIALIIWFIVLYLLNKRLKFIY